MTEHFGEELSSEDARGRRIHVIIDDLEDFEILDIEEEEGIDEDVRDHRQHIYMHHIDESPQEDDGHHDGEDGYQDDEHGAVPQHLQNSTEDGAQRGSIGESLADEDGLAHGIGSALLSHDIQSIVSEHNDREQDVHNSHSGIISFTDGIDVSSLVSASTLPIGHSDDTMNSTVHAAAVEKDHTSILEDNDESVEPSSIASSTHPRTDINEITRARAIEIDNNDTVTRTIDPQLKYVPPISISDHGKNSFFGKRTIMNCILALLMAVALYDVFFQHSPIVSSGDEGITIEEVKKGKGDLSIFHIDHSLFKELEDNKCDTSACCFKSYILTGHPQSHKLAVKSFLEPGEELEVLKLSQLYDLMEKASEETISGDRVILVENAEKLKTREVERIFRTGDILCKVARKERRKSKSKIRIIVFLSTNFGSDILETPEQVTSSTLMEYMKSDWLAIPQIVANPKRIVHEIKGFKPRKVFLDFFGNQMAREKYREQPNVHKPLGKGDEEVYYLDAWLTSKADLVAITPPAVKLLLKQLANKADGLNWLEEQYHLWTEGSTRRVVVYKEGAKHIGVFQVS